MNIVWNFINIYVYILIVSSFILDDESGDSDDSSDSEDEKAKNSQANDQGKSINDIIQEAKNKINQDGKCQASCEKRH